MFSLRPGVVFPLFPSFLQGAIQSKGFPLSISNSCQSSMADSTESDPRHHLSVTTPQQISKGEPNSYFRVKKLSKKAILPSRGSPLSAGYDLSSATEVKVPARGKALVSTDLSIAVPEGTYARVAPRSGLAWKHSIDVGAGVIDADYRGPVGVILFNHSDIDFEVKAGDRIAQLIIEKIMTPEVTEVEDLDATARGDGGFGSTGI
ncbi:hypothetical protein I3843_15G071500 [Carya illinoinensis]|nr:hypothetical protein I3760_15G072800 [Carya illinoinensis]KAG7943935.1 hypothetical protein I3843_15G071500 [Carya illinoinensis]